MKITIPIIYGAAVASAIAIQINNEEPKHTLTPEAPQLTPLQSKTPDKPANQSKSAAAPPLSLIRGSQLIHDPTQVKEDPAPSSKVSKVKPPTADSNTIPEDQRVIHGRLDNGMRYILMQNDKPEERVSMRLHVGAGSLNESDDQRGVAHFLEHMVFNGTKNFPDSKKLIPKMQRLGIAFGAHANAYTSLDETVYMLDLPNVDQDTLTLAFDVMQDFAGGALLEKHEIDEERGVILAEKNSRDSVGMRILLQQFEKLFPNSILKDRMPIGIEEVIKNAKRDRFTDFYERFYHPKNMCFVYVGDFDPNKAKQAIQDAFEGLTEPANPGPPPSVGDLKGPKGFQSSVFSDKELTTTDISLTISSPYQIKADTVSNRSSKIPLSIANRILSKRFSNLILEDPNLPILSGSASRNVLFKEIELGGISVTAKDGQWKEALPILVREYKRALEHGFTEKELNEAKANILNSYENRVKSASTRQSPSLATSLVANYHNNTVFSTPEKDLEIISQALDKLSLEVSHKAFKEFWNTKDLHLSLTGPNASAEDESVLLALFRSEAAKSTEAPELESAIHFAYSDLGTKGTIKSSAYVDDLDFTQLVLSNQIRVNYKKTDFQANRILVSAYFGGGKLSQPLDKPGIDQMAETVMNMGGLGKHDMQDLQSILAGKSAGLSFGIDSNRFSLSGGTTKEDLELHLQLLTASLKDAGFNPQGEQILKSQLPQIFKNMKHSNQGGLNEMGKLLSGHDPRFGLPSQEALATLTTEDVKQWIEPQMKDSYLEITIVGDFEKEQLESLLLSTVGTLSSRADTPIDYSATEVLPLVDFPLKKQFTYESKVPNAIAVNVWRTNKTGKSISESRRLNILASILTERMRVKLREDLGKAYSPNASSRPSYTFENNSYLMAMSPGAPEDIEKIAEIIEQLADDLATKGATQDELTRALEPSLANLEKSLTENSYWFGSVLRESQSHPERLSWARERDKDYASITLEEINALTKKYLVKSKAAQFTITPE